MSAGREVDYIAVHCSATRALQDVGATEIDKWHRARGFRMIGYHFVIRRNGMVERGRPLDSDHILEPNEVGAHVEGYNSRSIGVCLVGGCNDKMDPENNFTIEQFTALAALLTTLRAQFPHAIIQGHRDFPNVHKACPSFDVKSWVRANGLI